jgi:hypothetical protein
MDLKFENNASNFTRKCFAGPHVANLSETARHGARKEESPNVYNVLFGKLKRKRQLGSSKLRQDNIKMYIN